MADPQRTHPATPKRIKEFRKRGEIALSRDLVTAAAFAGGSIALLAIGGTGFGRLRELARDAATAADGSDATPIGHEALRAFGTIAAPVALTAAGAGLVAIATQLGWPPALRGFKLNLAKLNPLGNLAGVFAPAQVARRTGGALLKLAAVGAVVAIALSGLVGARPSSIGALAELVGSTIRHALLAVAGALALAAGVDYILARRRITAQMRMTADEIKREHRESDGDPHVKGRRRQKMKELAKRRMRAAVAKADVVVVNPTHYAVALRYDDKRDAAPVVVAKGIDEQAQKIRDVAREHGVPVLSRPPLARALHALVKEGQPVPSKLYRAVAEVLAFVYRIKHRSAA